MSDAKHEGQDRLAATTNKPAVGEEYTHRKGGIYKVLAVGCIEADGTPFVAYRSYLRGTTWMRTLENWNEVVEGKPRFVHVEKPVRDVMDIPEPTHVAFRGEPLCMWPNKMPHGAAWSYVVASEYATCPACIAAAKASAEPNSPNPANEPEKAP